MAVAAKVDFPVAALIGERRMLENEAGLAMTVRLGYITQGKHIGRRLPFADDHWNVMAEIAIQRNGITFGRPVFAVMATETARKGRVLNPITSAVPTADDGHGNGTALMRCLRSTSVL